MFSPWLAYPTPIALAATLTLALPCGLAFLVLRRGEHRLVHTALGMVFIISLASTIYRCGHSMSVLCVPTSATRYVYSLQVIFLWHPLAHARDRSRFVHTTCLAFAA